MQYTDVLRYQNGNVNTARLIFDPTMQYSGCQLMVKWGKRIINLYLKCSFLTAYYNLLAYISGDILKMIPIIFSDIII